VRHVHCRRRRDHAVTARRASWRILDIVCSAALATTLSPPLSLSLSLSLSVAGGFAVAPSLRRLNPIYVFASRLYSLHKIGRDLGSLLEAYVSCYSVHLDAFLGFSRDSLSCPSQPTIASLVIPTEFHSGGYSRLQALRSLAFLPSRTERPSKYS
jgi:hypothetical protein